MFTQNFTKPDALPNGEINFDDLDYPLQPGDTVVPFFDAGQDAERQRAKNFLKAGKRYLVRQVEVYSLRTEVYLEGFSVSFAMVNLKKVAKEARPPTTASLDDVEYFQKGVGPSK